MASPPRKEPIGDRPRFSVLSCFRIRSGITLADVPDFAGKLLAGQVRGRLVVKVGGCPRDRYLRPVAPSQRQPRDVRVLQLGITDQAD